MSAFLGATMNSCEGGRSAAADCRALLPRAKEARRETCPPKVRFHSNIGGTGILPVDP